jgi:hypothetical protein
MAEEKKYPGKVVEVKVPPIEKKFDIGAQITRATYFAFRETAKLMCPNVNMMEMAKKFWEITARDTAPGYLKNIDPSKPLPEQIARSFVWSSLVMGESAKLIVASDKEAYCWHDSCPWFDWASRLDKKDPGVLVEDEPGCSAWFIEVVKLINQKLGTNVKIKTEKSLPAGDGCCVRKIWVD